MIVVAIVILTLLLSCGTQKNAIKWMQEHPEQASKYCAEAFPVKIIPVDSVVRFDTLYIDNTPIADEDSISEPDRYFNIDDSVVKVSPVNPVWTARKIKCPPTQIITRTITKTNNVIDSALNVAHRLAYTTEHKVRVQAENDRDEWKVKAQNRFWMIVAACMTILLLLFILFKKPKILK